MPTLERLEKGCKNKYAKAFNEFQARNEAFHFYTPKNKITIVDTCSKADAALNTTLIIIQHKKKYVTLSLLLIVTSHQIYKQLQEIGDQWSGIATQLARKKAVVLVSRLYVSRVLDLHFVSTI